MTSRTEKLEVNGEDIDVDTEELEVRDLGAAMDQVAAQVSRYGMLWGQAEQEKIQVDTAYRNWRAGFGTKVLSSEPKLAEWKVRLAIEASPKFTRYKQAIAVAARNVVILRAHVDAFKVKASILQSKGAMLRAELDATGMNTRRAEKVAKDGEERKRTSKAVAKTLGKKKPKRS